MTKPFLPEGYKVPKTGGGQYTKFNEGANRLRILCAPILGYEYWNVQGKPVRAREYPEGIPKDIRVKDGKPEKIKHFWAFVVWNYLTRQLEILEITQSSIQGALTALVDNPDWGDPREYDITVTKTGSGMDTEYTVLPGKQAPINPVVKSDFEKKAINLEALFDGGNPFEAADGAVAEKTEEEIDSRDDHYGEGPGKGENGDWSGQD